MQNNQAEISIIQGSNALEQWMLSPGIIKKLQVALSISLIINMIFIYQLIYTKLDKPTKETPHNKTPLVKEHKTKISDQDLKAFVKQYLISFFTSQEGKLEFIKEHTDTDLYQNNLNKELEARKALDLSSNFELMDIYLESINEKTARAFVTGKEIFAKQDYINRNYSIELIINTEELKIINIPKFEINS